MSNTSQLMAVHLCEVCVLRKDDFCRELVHTERHAASVTECAAYAQIRMDASASVYMHVHARMQVLSLLRLCAL